MESLSVRLKPLLPVRVGNTATWAAGGGVRPKPTVRARTPLFAGRLPVLLMLAIIWLGVAACSAQQSKVEVGDKALRDYFQKQLFPWITNSLAGQASSLASQASKTESALTAGRAAIWLSVLAGALAAYALWRSRQQQPAMLQVARLEAEVRALRQILSPSSATVVRPVAEPAWTDLRTTAATKPRDPTSRAGPPVEKPSPKPSGSPSASGLPPASAATARPVVKPAAPREPASRPEASQSLSPVRATKSLPAIAGSAVAQPGVPAAGKPGQPLLQPSVEDESKPVASVAPLEPAEPLREALGRVFKPLCQQGLASYLDDLLPALQSTLPDAVVRPAYHPTKAQELYFSDSEETSSLWYWRVTLKNQDYLLPRPESAKAFSGIDGFRTPPRNAFSPEKLELCVPALLEARGKRWEITDPGTLA